MTTVALKRILVADDDPSIRISLNAMLTADGYEVSEAEDGRDAIEALLNEHFDLAILDLAMPNIDGLEVLKEYQLVRGAEATPILILTAFDSVTACVETARCGAIDFLKKPILPEKLRSAVRRAIAGRIPRPLIDHGENFFG
jgi:DNA-binding NtrC family response regulator